MINSPVEGNESGSEPNVNTPAPDAANITSVSSETAGKISALQALPEGHGLESDAHQKTTLDVLAFIESPGEKSITDIEECAAAIGFIQEDFAMDGQDEPQLISDTLDRLNRMGGEYYIGATRAELTKESPDLMVALAMLRKAKQGLKKTSPDLLPVVDALQQELEAKNLTHPLYEKLLQVAAITEDAMPHIADPKELMFFQTMVPALRSGDEVYIAEEQMQKLLKKMQKDTGKNGEESLAALRSAQQKITDLTGYSLPEAQA